MRAIDPAPLVRAAIARFPPVEHPLYVIAAGKAAYGMARGLCDAEVPIAAALGAGPAPVRRELPSAFRWVEPAHPDPDPVSVEAGARALALAVQSRGATLVVLLSGGASAMLAVPAPGIPLADKIVAASALMRAGVDIAGLNCVRKHLSAIKGGRLGAAAVESVTLAISDVHAPVPDDPAVIGSGPTVPDPTTFADALRVVRESGAAVPPQILAHLESGQRGDVEETPKPGDRRLARATYELLANRHTAMDAAAAVAKDLGYEVVLLRGAITGEAREAGDRFAQWALAHASRPLCAMASGETTVHVRGRGRGGRNQEFALGATALLTGREGVLLASVGTDGIDGSTHLAGGMVNGTTRARAERAGVPVDTALAENDAHAVFERLGDGVRTGPTGTNVGDLHLLLMS